MTKSEFFQVTTTTGSRDDAGDLAQKAVDRRLAACAQIEQIDSVYWWDGKVQTDPELRITFKTSADVVQQLVTTLRELHSYQVPEIIVTPIVGGDPDYLAWIATETSNGPRDAVGA